MLQVTGNDQKTFPSVLHSYANLNIWVFSLVLKVSTDVASRMLLGRSFQSFGALTLKAALVRRYLVEKFRSSRVGSLSQRRLHLFCFLGMMRSFRY